MNIKLNLKHFQGIDIFQAFLDFFQNNFGNIENKEQKLQPFIEMGRIRASINYKQYHNKLLNQMNYLNNSQLDSNLTQDYKVVLNYLQYLIYVIKHFNIGQQNPNHVNMSFTWQSAFNPNHHTTLSSPLFEFSCHLYNLAVLNYFEAENLMQSQSQKDKQQAILKLRFAVGCLFYVRVSLSNIENPQDIPFDMNEEYIKVLEYYFLSLCYLIHSDIQEKNNQQIQFDQDILTAIINESNKYSQLALESLQKIKDLISQATYKQLKLALDTISCMAESQALVKMANFYFKKVQKAPEEQNFGLGTSFLIKCKNQFIIQAEIIDSIELFPGFISYKLKNTLEFVKNNYEICCQQNSKTYLQKIFETNELPEFPELGEKLKISPIISAELTKKLYFEDDLNAFLQSHGHHFYQQQSQSLEQNIQPQEQSSINHPNQVVSHESNQMNQNSQQQEQAQPSQVNDITIQQSKQQQQNQQQQQQQFQQLQQMQQQIQQQSQQISDTHEQQGNFNYFNPSNNSNVQNPFVQQQQYPSQYYFQNNVQQQQQQQSQQQQNNHDDQSIPQEEINYYKQFVEQKMNSFQGIQQLIDMKSQLYAQEYFHNILNKMNDKNNDQADSKKQMPPQIKELYSQFLNLGGGNKLANNKILLDEMEKQCTDKIKDQEKSLQREEEEDQSLKAIFMQNWNRNPSKIANKDYIDKIQNYQEKLNQAIMIDQQAFQKYDQLKAVIELFSKNENEILNHMPSDQSPALNKQQSIYLNQIKTYQAQLEEILVQIQKIQLKVKEMIANFDFSMKIKEANMQNIPKQNQLQFIVYPFEANFEELQKLATQGMNVYNQLQQTCQHIQHHDHNFIQTEISKFVDSLQKINQIFIDMDLGIKFYENFQGYIEQHQKKIEDFIMARNFEKDDLQEQLNNPINASQNKKNQQFNKKNQDIVYVQKSNAQQQQQQQQQQNQNNNYSNNNYSYEYPNSQQINMPYNYQQNQQNKK